MNRFFLLLTLCTLSLASCQKDAPVEPTPEPEPQPEPTFTITSESSIEVKADGGYASVTYALENRIEGLWVEVVYSDEWMQTASHADNEVMFVVLKNYSTEPRTGCITLTYGDIEHIVTVEQRGATNEERETTFVITSPEVRVAAEGGEIEVWYSVENPIEGVSVEVASAPEWATLLSEDDSLMTFSIAKNEATEPRTAIITLSYGDLSDSVSIYQAAAEGVAPEPTYTELNHLSGLYFGNQYGATEGDYNYSLVLSTVANCLDIITGEVTLLENSTYLFLDLYAAAPAENYNISFTVPEGEYELDVMDSCVAGTIGAYYSSLYITNETEGEEIFFVSGSVSVTEEGIEAKLYDGNGNLHHYLCKQTSVDNSQNFGPSFAPGEQSTLDGDLIVEFSDGAIYAECYGDYYVIGKNTWMYFVDDYATGNSFCFELLTDRDADYPIGTFPVSNDLNQAQMALPGYVNADGNIFWSWYSLYDYDYSVLGSAPIVDGQVEIVDNGDETFTITIAVKDDMGYSLSGVCTAYGEFYGTRAATHASHTMSATRKCRIN